MSQMTQEQTERLRDSCEIVLKYAVMGNHPSLSNRYDRLGAMMDIAYILGYMDAWDLIKEYKDKIGAGLDAIYAALPLPSPRAAEKPGIAPGPESAQRGLSLAGPHRCTIIQQETSAGSAGSPAERTDRNG